MMTKVPNVNSFFFLFFSFFLHLFCWRVLSSLWVFFCLLFKFSTNYTHNCTLNIVHRTQSYTIVSKTFTIEIPRSVWKNSRWNGRLSVDKEVIIEEERKKKTLFPFESTEMSVFFLFFFFCSQNCRSSLWHYLEPFFIPFNF